MCCYSTLFSASANLQQVCRRTPDDLGKRPTCTTLNNVPDFGVGAPPKEKFIVANPSIALEAAQRMPQSLTLFRSRQQAQPQPLQHRQRVHLQSLQLFLLFPRQVLHLS